MALIDKLLREFAKENFGDHEGSYFPVVHGRTQDIKLLTLVVKKPTTSDRECGGKPQRYTVLTELGRYAAEENAEEFEAIMKKHIVKEDCGVLQEGENEDDKGAGSSVEIGGDADNFGRKGITISEDLGSLVLGRIDQEYIRDPDLREILAKTDIDNEKTGAFEGQQLSLIISVIFSERFEVKGKRRNKMEGEAEVNPPGVKETCKTIEIPPNIATRPNSRGPILFKCCRVVYNKETNRLELSDEEVVGKDFLRCKEDEEDDEIDNKDSKPCLEGDFLKNQELIKLFRNRNFFRKLIDNLLREFAKENFGDKEGHYLPVVHGRTQDIKLFTLVVRTSRYVLERPFKRYTYTVVAGLEHYVADGKRKEYEALKNKKVKKNNEIASVGESEDGSGAASYCEAGAQAGNIANIKIKINEDLGSLELGGIDEEYILDPDLREVLAKTELDINKTEVFEDQQLRLITSVMYSQRFVVKGNRKIEVEADAGINIPLHFLSQMKGKYIKVTIPPNIATRANTRGPILFQCCRVVLNKDKNRLELPKGEVVGRPVNRCKEDEEEESKNTAVSLVDDMDSYLIGKI
ncbi:unnamed protein product, partial [Porites lobata]